MINVNQILASLYRRIRKKNERYITDAEYQSVYLKACPVVRAAMEISYICMARIGDVIKLEASQLTNDGIFIRQGKTGKKQIKRWGNRLRQAIKTANEINPKIASMFVIHQSNGSSYTYSGFRKRWDAAKAAALSEAKKKNPSVLFDFTFHDIKAKGISDFEGTVAEKQTSAGHKTQRQTSTYDRRIQVVDTVESKKNDQKISKDIRK